MLSIILMIITVLSAILALIQKDLLKAAILTGFSGGALAVLFQLLLLALAVKKTQRDGS